MPRLGLWVWQVAKRRPELCLWRVELLWGDLGNWPEESSGLYPMGGGCGVPGSLLHSRRLQTGLSSHPFSLSLILRSLQAPWGPILCLCLGSALNGTLQQSEPRVRETSGSVLTSKPHWLGTHSAASVSVPRSRPSILGCTE